jgi:hypothetical protein
MSPMRFLCLHGLGSNAKVCPDIHTPVDGN